MDQLAPGVWLLRGFPRNAINVYLVEDVLIDAGTRWCHRRIAKQVRGRPISAVALTHCHADHQGSAHRLCLDWNVPLACPEADVPAMEGLAPLEPQTWGIRFFHRLWGGPPHKVDRVLREGDEVAGFRVIAAPGHTPGQVMFFRESDRVAIVGDVLNHMHLVTMRTGLHEPPRLFTADAAENRRSIRRLVELSPRLVCFGHGPPLRDVSRLERFVESATQGALRDPGL